MKKKTNAPSLEDARQHYAGHKADVYDERRVHKAKWKLEHQCLGSMLQGVRGSVLDVPVGTGRFLQLYRDMGLVATGVDYNLAMLKHARSKDPIAVLEQGDITNLRFSGGSFDVVVCVRLLHLIASDEVAVVVRELLRVARHHVIVTIHFGEAASVRGRSQVHVANILDCVQPPWVIASSKLLMEEKSVGRYYMVHIRRQ